MVREKRRKKGNRDLGKGHNTLAKEIYTKREEEKRHKHMYTQRDTEKEKDKSK